MSLQSFSSAKVLMGPESWNEDHGKAFAINLRIAEYVPFPKNSRSALLTCPDS